LSLTEALLRLVLARRSRYRPRSQASRPRLAISPGGPVRVAAVQLKLFLTASPAVWARRMHDLAARAVREDARLVVFPEDVALPLLGMVPGLSRKAGRLLAGGPLRPADLFAFLDPYLYRVYRAVFTEVARTWGIWVAAGSLPRAVGRGVQNVGTLFGPDGTPLLSQAKTHLLPLEEQWGLVPGDELAVYDAGWGKLALPVCMDATFFETFRLLAALGAEVVLLPTANPEPYNRYKALRGIWPRVQESRVFGVQSALVGELFGYTLEGKSGIYAPWELTPGQDGVLAEAADPRAETVVWADLDLAALRAWRTGHPRVVNADLYRRYLPDVYGPYPPE
jgi:predicted amidohydrolase